MEITIYNRTNQDLSYYQKLYEDIAFSCENILHLSRDKMISVTFVRSRTIHQINKEYRFIDRPTDVISFAINDEPDIIDSGDLGDLFINIDYASKQAKQYGHSLEREMGFLFTHGLLHCLGYDHMNKEDEEEMFRLQDLILDPIIARNHA